MDIKRELEGMKTSESINELGEALALAQGEINNPEKNANNPHFKSNYADLAGVLGTIRPAFAKVGLAIIQSPHTTDNGNIGVTTRVIHKSGQWIEDVIDVPMQRGNNLAQEAGKVITYLRRYSAAAFAGVHQSDPDAQGVEGEVVDMKPEFSQQQIDAFGEQMRAYMDAGDFMAVGRSLIDPEKSNIWQAANRSTPKTGGQFTSKQKALQSEMVAQYKDQVGEWASEAITHAEGGYVDAVMEIVNDIDPVEKNMFWSLLDSNTQQFIKQAKAAA
jgi:hypothetical protein